MTDNFLDDPASSARVGVDSFFEDTMRNLDFTSANEIATATVAMTNPEDVEGAHDNIVNELVSSGTSATVEQLREAIGQGKKGVLRSAIFSKLSDINVGAAEKEEMRQLYVDMETEGIYNKVNLEKEMLRSFSQASVMEAEEGSELQNRAMWSEGFDTVSNTHSEINSSIETFQNELATETSNWKIIKDSALSMLPLEQGFFYRNVISSFLPGQESLKDIIFHGEALKKLQDHFTTLDPASQLSEAQRLLDVIKETGSFMGDNALNKMYAASDILDMVAGNKDPKSVNWMRWLQDVTGVLDTIGIGVIAKKVPTLFSRITGQLPKIELANPKLATPLVQEAIISEKVAAKVGKTSSEVFNEHMLVAHEDTIRTMNVTDRAVIDSMDLSEEVQETAARILDMQNSVHAYTTPQMKTAVTEKLIDEVQGLKGMYLNTNYSAMGDAPIKTGADGASFKGVFGKKEGGFTSWAEAMGAAKKAMPDEVPKILVASPETGGVLRYVDDVPEISKGEYFVEVQKFMYWDEASDVLELGKVRHAGSMTEYIMDHQSVLAKPWVDGINRMIDNMDRIRTSLFKVWKPVKNAVAKDERVFHSLALALEETGKVGRRLSSSELDRIGMSTPDLQKVYTAQMDVTDLTFIAKNSRDRAAKISKGFDKQVVDASSGYSAPVRIFDTVPVEDVDLVYDVANGVFKGVNKEEMVVLYNQGHRVGKLEHANIKISKAVDGQGAKALGSNFVLIRKGSKTKVQDLPNIVNGYIPGYTPRRFTDPYFIVEVIPNALINGRVPTSEGISGLSRAITSSPTKGKAEEAVALLNAKAEDGVRYEMRYDRNIAKEQVELFHKQVDLSRGAAIQHRGKGLTDIDQVLGAEHGLDRLAETQHPMKAMEDHIISTARHGSHDKTMRDMQRAFTNQYAEFLKATDGKFPLSEGLITGPPSARFREARAAYRHIARLDGAVDNVGKNVREGMLRLSEKVGDWGFGKTSAFIAGHKDVAPIRTLRSLNFFKMIASDPIKQWILQPSQILFTAGAAPKYALTRLVPDMSLAYSGLLLKNMPASSPLRAAMPDMKRLASLFGETEANFTGMLRSLEDSGVLLTDSHAFLKNVSYRNLSDLYNSSAEKSVAKTMNALKVVNKKFVDVGFNPAERMNMMGQWMIARNRVLEKSPNLIPGTKAYTEAIGAEARGIGLGMKKGFAYSENQFFSLGTQFMSFQHKTWLAIFGGNRYFSPSDRVGLAVTQGLLWGTAGLGIKSAFDSALARFGVDKDSQTPLMKEVIEVAEDGMLEKMLNGMLSAAGIDDMNVAWADRYSVLNAYQNNIVKTAISLFGGETQVGVDLLLGPSKTTFTGTRDMLGTLAMINKTHDVDSATFWTMHVKNAAAWVPALSRALQFQVAANTGLLPNATGTYFTDATMKEAAWYALTGMNSKEREAHFEIMDLTTEGKARAAKSDARVMYEQMSKATIILDAEDLTPDLYEIYDKKLKASMYLIGTVLDKADPFYKAAIEKELGQLISNDPKRGKDGLLYRLGKFYSLTGEDGAQSLHKIQQIRNKADALKLDDGEREAIDSLIQFYKDGMSAFSTQEK